MKKYTLVILLLAFLSPSMLFADRTITPQELSGSTPLYIRSNEVLIIPYYMLGALNADRFEAKQSLGDISLDVNANAPWGNKISISCIQSTWNLIQLPAIAGVTIYHYRRYNSPYFDGSYDALISTQTVNLTVFPPK